MAIIVKRYCGLGADRENYVQISDITYCIDNVSAFKPIHVVKTEIRILLDEESREFEVFTQDKDIDKSNLTEIERFKCEELQKKGVTPVNTMFFEEKVSNLNKDKLAELLSLKYQYELIKKHKHPFLGVPASKKKTDIKDNTVKHTTPEAKKKIQEKILKKYIREGK